MIDQLSVFLENKPGRLAELTRLLGDAGINMHALMVADTSEFGMIRVICDTPARAKDLLDDAGFGATVTQVSAVAVPNRPGGLADVLDCLGAARLNIEYAYCFVESKGDAAVDVVKVEGQGAEDVLSASGFRVLSADELYVADAPGS